MTLFIKVRVLHVEFHLYFSKIRFKKSSVLHTQYTSIMFIFCSLSPLLRFILGYTEVEIFCALTTEIPYRLLASRRGARLS